MRKWIGLLIAVLVMAAVSGALAVGSVTIDMPDEIWCNDDPPVFTFHCPGARSISLWFNVNTDGVTDGVALDESGNGTFTAPYSPKKGGSGSIKLTAIYDTEGNRIENSSVFPFTIKTNGSLPAAKINVPSKIEIGQALVLTMPSDDSSIEYEPRMSARDSDNYFALNYYDPLWEAGKTYTIPGESTDEEDVYSLHITAFKKHYDATTTSFKIIAGNPVAEYATIMTDFSDQSEALKLLSKYGIITLKNPEAAYVTESDITKKPRALKFDYVYPVVDSIQEYIATGSSFDYVILAPKTAEDISRQMGVKFKTVLAGDTVSLYSLQYGLNDLCSRLGIATPTATDPVKDEITKSGGVYKLNHKKLTATLIKPSNKNATKLTIPAKVSANGKTYKVTEIKANACKGMKKLKTLTIGANVTKIGKNAFANCAKLKKITIKNAKMKKTAFGAKCFSGIDAKAVFKVPKKVLKDYEKWIRSKGKPPKTVTIKK